MAQGPDTATSGTDMPYATPPAFLNGEHLSAYKLRLLAANDDYFSGVADRFEMTGPQLHGMAWHATAGYYFFYGNIHLRTGGTVYWRFTYAKNGSTAGEHIALILDKGLATEHILHTTDHVEGDSTHEGSEAHGLTTGLHTICLEGTWDWYDPTGHGTYPLVELEYAYEIPGATGYEAPHDFTDGNVSALTDFTHLSGNDTFFRSIEPGNHPFVGVSQVYGDHSGPGWRTHYKFRAGCTRCFYKNIGVAKDIVVGDGSGIDETVSMGADSESYFDLTNAFVAGTWYTITGGYMTGYVAFGAPGATVPSGFASLGEFSPGQFGWGTTANQRARLQLLHTNDESIYTRLAMADYAGRRHAVAQSPFTGAGSGTQSFAVTYYLKHLLPVLNYTGAAVTLSWGVDNTLALPASSGLTQVDLSSVTSLGIGQLYSVAGASYVYEVLS